MNKLIIITLCLVNTLLVPSALSIGVTDSLNALGNQDNFAALYENEVENMEPTQQFQTKLNDMAVAKEPRSISPAFLELATENIVVIPSAKPSSASATTVYLQFRKRAFSSGQLGFVAFGKLSPGAYKSSDHRIRVDTTTEHDLQTLATNNVGMEVVVKFAKDSDPAKQVLVNENNSNKCLKAHMPLADYNKYVAEYVGHFLSQCIKVVKKKKLKKVGHSGDTLTELQSGALDETNLPDGVCSYLVFKKAGTSTVKAYVENNLAHMDTNARIAFGRRITHAFLAMLNAGFLHGDAHMENMLVDDHGDNPKWIDISGLKPIKDAAFGGAECTATDARMTKNPDKAGGMWYELYGSTEANGQDYASLNKLWKSLGYPTNANHCINKIHEYLQTKFDAVAPRLQQAIINKTGKVWADLAALVTDVNSWYQPILDTNTNFPTFAGTNGCSMV